MYISKAGNGLSYIKSLLFPFIGPYGRPLVSVVMAKRSSNAARWNSCQELFITLHCYGYASCLSRGWRILLLHICTCLCILQPPTMQNIDPISPFDSALCSDINKRCKHELELSINRPLSSRLVAPSSCGVFVCCHSFIYSTGFVWNKNASIRFTWLCHLSCSFTQNGPESLILCLFATKTIPESCYIFAIFQSLHPEGLAYQIIGLMRQIAGLCVKSAVGTRKGREKPD